MTLRELIIVGVGSFCLKLAYDAYKDRDWLGFGAFGVSGALLIFALTVREVSEWAVQ